MDEDTEAAAWHQQEQEEAQQLEEKWRAMCAALHRDWKAQAEAMASFEATERK